MSKETRKIELKGGYEVWKLLGSERTYADITLPYADAVEFVSPVRYNAVSGKGEQRATIEAHVRKLKGEMQDGNFTPTQVSAGVRKSHIVKLVMNVERQTFTLGVDSGDPLPQTDGGHRYEALTRIHKELTDSLEAEEDVEKKQAIQTYIDELLVLPVGIRLFLDGNTQRDFINLQAGRPVDAAHLFSMKIQQKVMDDPAYKVAFDCAKLLQRQDGSPFVNVIRLDSRGTAPLPISSLCQKGGSDLGTSLIGLARVASAGEGKPLDASRLAFAVIAAHKAIAERHPGLLESGKVLATIGNGGTKGSATMMVGLGIVLAFRQAVQGDDLPSEDDLTKLADAASKSLDVGVNGNFSGSVKRSLIGDFAKIFLADLDVEKHDKLPALLLRTLSPSAFGATSLPKQKPAKPAKKAKKPKAERAALPDVDSPIEVTNEPVTVTAADAAPWEEAGDPAHWDGDEAQG